MSFAGLSKPEDRANIIVYLNSMGSNVPLPAVEAAPAAPVADAAAAKAGDTASGPAQTTPAAAGATAQPAPGGDKAVSNTKQ